VSRYSGLVWICQSYLIGIHLNIKPLKCLHDGIQFYLVRPSWILLLLNVMSARMELEDIRHKQNSEFRGKETMDRIGQLFAVTEKISHAISDTSG
jgi:hypothetical protein